MHRQNVACQSTGPVQAAAAKAALAPSELQYSRHDALYIPPCRPIALGKYGGKAGYTVIGLITSPSVGATTPGSGAGRLADEAMDDHAVVTWRGFAGRFVSEAWRVSIKRQGNCWQVAAAA